VRNPREFAKIGHSTYAKENTMNCLLADIPGTTSKVPTTKFCLPETGFVRLKNIIAPDGPIPVSKSTWWKHVKSISLDGGNITKLIFGQSRFAIALLRLFINDVFG
jgi:hypothetical protein